MRLDRLIPRRLRSQRSRFPAATVAMVVIAGLLAVAVPVGAASSSVTAITAANVKQSYCDRVLRGADLDGAVGNDQVCLAGGAKTERNSKSHPSNTTTTTTTTVAPSGGGGGGAAPAPSEPAPAPSEPTAPAAPSPTASGLVHPGVLLDRAQLDAVRVHIAAGRQPWTAALDRVYASGSSSRTDLRATSQRYSSLSYVPAPVSTIQAAGSSGTAYMAARPELGLRNIGGVEHLDDARAAYTHALLWQYTGNRAHGAKAIEIMNAWSASLREIKFDQPRRLDTGGQLFDQGKLQAGWGGSLFARAGEIVRYSDAGWSATDVARFESMLREVHLPLVITGWTNGANWLMTFAEATMGIGVFIDDRAIFDAGVAMWRRQTPATIYLPTDGALPVAPHAYYDTAAKLTSLWYNPTQFISGLQAETLRDLSHTMMGMGAMANGAETARIQGIDLFHAEKTRILAGFERQASYVNQYLDELDRTGAAPSSTWRPTNWVGSRFELGGTAYRAGWEVAYNHYAKRLGIAMPETARLVQRLGPQSTSASLHLSWETLTHTR